MPVNRRSPRPTEFDADRGFTAPSPPPVVGLRPKRVHARATSLARHGRAIARVALSALGPLVAAKESLRLLSGASRCGTPCVQNLRLLEGRAPLEKPRAASRRQPRATWAPAPANCESGLDLPPGAAIRLAKFHTSCQFRHQFGICRQSLRRTPGGTGSSPAVRHSSMMRYAAGRSDADRIQNYRVRLNHVRR